MREFTQEEIINSLKDDSLHMVIAGSLFLEDVTKIEQDLRQYNRKPLADLIKSKLKPEAIEELIAKNVLEEEELTNIGLAHVHVFLQEHHLIEQTENAETSSDQKAMDDRESEIKAMIYLSLSKFDIKEVTQLYKEKKEKVLTHYLSKNMNDTGIKKLLEYKIVTLQNTITDLGWMEIENYIKAVAGEQEKKKWWEFWK